MQLDEPKAARREERSRARDNRAPNETRYASIIEGSNYPMMRMILASALEDPSLRFPRILFRTLLTSLSMPAAQLARTPDALEKVVYQTLHACGRSLMRISASTLEVIGASSLDPSRTYLFVANHSSPMDIPALYASVPVNAAFVANKQLGDIPIFSYWMRRSGAVFVDQGDPKAELRALQDMVSALKGGRSLILFPEGYINQAEELVEFKRGGIRAATMAGVLVVPTLIHGTDGILKSGSMVMHRDQHVIVEFGEVMDTACMDISTRRSLDQIIKARLQEMKRARKAVIAS